MMTSQAAPNFLIVMTDEHGPMFSHTHGHPLVETPNMDRLAQAGITFDNAYCNQPICVPSRASFMAGRYSHHVGVWDNATPLALDAVTWPYLLRARGYDAVLAGKMHLIGPDQLHGFRQQLAVDLHAQLRLGVYPWEDGIQAVPLENARRQDLVRRAGPGTTRAIEADDQAEVAALAYLRDPSRRERPFALCVGFIAPHFPLIVPEPYFSQYYPDRTDLPRRPDGRDEEPTAATRRLQVAYGYLQDHSAEEIRRARAAYYGLVSYVDAKLGRLIDSLQECGLAENTIVIHTSDHGEMLGEHGLWGKSCFYEQSARVPLQIAGPGIGAGQRVREAVSLVDVVATVLDLAGLAEDERRDWRLDGQSLRPALQGDRGALKDEVFAEYTARGTDRGRAMIRTGRWKLCYGHGNPPEIELYDLEADPGEFNNLADDSAYRDVKSDLVARIVAEWDPQEITATAIKSQRARKLIRAAQREGEFLF